MVVSLNLMSSHVNVNHCVIIQLDSVQVEVHQVNRSFDSVQTDIISLESAAWMSIGNADGINFSVGVPKQKKKKSGMTR